MILETRALSKPHVVLWLRLVIVMGFVIRCLCILLCFLLRRYPMR
jgi:hypothetical protein